MTQSFTPTGCLLNAIRRDRQKGGDGSRSTREVADFCSLSLSTARRDLYKLQERGLVEAFELTGEGNAIGWQLQRGLSEGTNVTVIRDDKSAIARVEKADDDEVTVRFTDGTPKVFLYQEIREIVG